MRLFLGALASLAVLCGVVVWWWSGASMGWHQWFYLAVALGLSELVAASLYVGRSAHTFTVSEIALTIGLVCGSPRALLFGVLVGPGVVLACRRGSPLDKMIFNTSQYLVTTALAIVIFRATRAASRTAAGTWVAAVGATTVATVASAVMIAVAIHLRESTSTRTTLTKSLVPSLVVTWSNTTIGLVLVCLWSLNPLSISLVVPVVVVVFVSHRAGESSRALETAVELIGDVVLEAATVHDPETGAPAIVNRLKAALNADVCELWLLPDRNRPVRCVSTINGRSIEGVVCESTVRETLSEMGDDVHSMAVNDGSSALGRWVRDEGFERAVVARLQTGDRYLGVLVLAYAPASSRVERPDDHRVLQSVAGHLAMSMNKAHVESAYSELRAAHQLVRHQASHDSLTDLANRRAFMDAIGEVLEPVGCLSALLYFDLDRFKPINDRLGHEAGDAVLVEVAKRLGALVRAQDLAARLGGDEFAILLADIPHPEYADDVAQRIRNDIGRPMRILGEDITVGVSIGVAVAKGGSMEPDQLLTAADTEMFRNKRIRHAVSAPRS